MANSSEQKSGLMDWNDVDSKKNRGQIDYLKLKSGGTYTVRLFNKPKHLLRYYNEVGGKKTSALCGDPANCPIAIKHPNIQAKDRYAIIVIDRADSKVKIMEAPATVFKDFKKFMIANDGIDPGGEEAPDFVISVTGEGRMTRYEVSYKMKMSRFTAEENVQIQAKVVSGYDLDLIFKPTDPAKIESILFPTEGGSESTASATPTATASAKTAAASEEDIPF